MNRRDLLKLAALSAVPTSLIHGRGALAAGEALEFGCPVPMSGAFAANGKFADLGMRLAIDQYGQVLGRPLRYSVLDTEGKPATAVRKVQELAQQKAARYFAGGILSSESLAMGKEAEKFGGVFVTTAGADEITGKDCNRATFRWSVPTFGAIERTVRPLIESMPKAKRWYTITPQYVFGDGLLSAAKAIFKEKGIEHVGNSYHALTEKEFSGYLTNALAAKPDVLLILNFGSQSADTLRQAVSFGMKKNTTILLAWASGLEQFESLGADLCEGVYFGAQYWHGVDTPLNRDLVKRTQAKFKANPNYSLAGSYICTKIMVDGMIKAGSADPRAVVAALEGMKYEGLTGPEEIRAADHQVLKNYYLLKGKAKARMKDKDDYAEIVSVGKAFLPVGQTQCKMA
ncbi:Branched-chain amino acid ABC transporter, periplasmic amino acid-binding protein (plasmid) [Cupriavidus taiwanensis]|uniref:Branched-chain amino acid ABC transporter, periplasmic amino acid-binding protein n=1 Tax=Cupriavidus taiwanensis TaxID=164546 RepID=A0A375HKR1_9BURK|nr:ABC transporter substrate-binding protein [Cupriavidus taiwanensis]SOY64998.1 Branched-chain amino acid ABC transporter, periplasmic amino acid- binding protein [Cupriavidus taiwanensis]SOY65289.1 Branched-chain amino acid ABC transporter, periplasmic amino acid- binding protein [Cupriavidus taiwanensis]SOY94123.1 Branched-chain amino acid ABC transporter, periplasmic amino acid- binding protein [Cupriavidus taiwanensis]SOZ69376.1 Branched-chain amino acid ABC transporter, periplasmic amino 